MSRIKARSDLYEMDLVLDVNVDVYPIEVGDKLGLCLASTLQLDGGPTSASFDLVRGGRFGPGVEGGRRRRFGRPGASSLAFSLWAGSAAAGGAQSPLSRLPWRAGVRAQSMQSGRSTLMDKYEYVMHGRVSRRAGRWWE